ncbi:HlyD family type I secretion periplasmic adaptor subunit [Rhizobium sp. WSM1325]|uniref:HlyD family type I secretion periplasmic adaptor subunit n=1 Tax=Rhizobium sp. WSM1325 TaxID=3444086 RepID=UPI001FE229A2|nr:HlyD family type I secretion periplasmic adaptor subunit [Rhizobium leguminosarum]
MPMVVGYGAIALMFCTLGVWGATAPIAGAAVAAGTVAAAGRNIHMQHLEGGIVREMHAREADHVRKGDTVMVLDDTVAKTQLNRLVKQWVSLSARIQRLAAERDGAETFKAEIHDEAIIPLTSGLTQIIDEEQKEFEARFARFRSEQLILHQRLDQLDETRNGLRQQKAAIEKQSSIIKDELARKQGLLDRGLINRSDYTELLRIDAELLGQMAALTSEQATTGSQIAEADEQIERQKTQRVEDAVTKLTETRSTLRDVQEQVAAALEVLQRTVIRAPTDGIVVTSLYNVIGNVIAPGEKIMEILPTTKRPLVEARLQPIDIDVIHIGQRARLRFSALNARLTPEVDATVQQVSADRLIDQATQQPYYRALLEITEALPASVPVDQLYPGMPVEAFISTGDRTFFDYLSQPLFDSARHAFIEE